MTVNLDVRQPTLTDLALAADSATDPLERLDALRALTDAVSDMRKNAVATARGEQASWSVIGACLKISKQAAAKRFGEARTVAPADDTGEGAPPARKPVRWDVTTPRGRTLLQVVTRR